MPQMVRVDCINKADRLSRQEHIRFIGGLNPDGTRWKLAENQAIAGIKAQQWQFYVETLGRRVYLVIAHSITGNEYLKTDADQELANNLLSLPECP